MDVRTVPLCRLYIDTDMMMIVQICCEYECIEYSSNRVLTRIFAIGGAICIINNLGGLVNNGCGQLHVHELQVAIQRSKVKQTLVKGQLTLFGEQVSSDIDNLCKN